jgi:hypothetical protein
MFSHFLLKHRMQAAVVSDAASAAMETGVSQKHDNVEEMIAQLLVIVKVTIPLIFSEGHDTKVS